MAKTKISEYDVTAGNNTDINSINIDEGCSPSGINNAIRAAMSHLKNFQTGVSGDSLTVGGALTVTGNTTLSSTLTANSSTGTSGQVLVSQGSSSSPTWGNAFVAGMIMLWSGSSATIPSGWLLCDGSNSTPDLRNRFVVGATSTYAVGATGGTADAIVVSHTHTATSTVTDAGHGHIIKGSNGTGSRLAHIAGSGAHRINDGQLYGTTDTSGHFAAVTTTTGITVSTSNSTEGSSGTNQNLPPYYALCYIMKT